MMRRITAEFEDSQRAWAAELGVPAARRGRGIAEQVALARRESPHRGRRHLALTRALRDELPGVGAALRAGRISEYRASLVAAETACLGTEDRLIVDAALTGDPEALEAMGDRETGDAARRLAAELDPAALAKRRRNAEADRTVTLRPAPDTMTWLTALLPVKDGVAAYAALRRAAVTATAAGDPRSRGQVMADALTARLTTTIEGENDGNTATWGRRPYRPELPPPPRVSLGLVMTDRALLGASGEAGWLDGYGPIPADLARELVHETLTSREKVWLTRLYTRPTTGHLVAAESRQRLFPASLAKLIRLRDRRCRSSWCDAPIAETDHATEAHAGGATSQANGQGACRGCNHAKQAPGWHAQAVPDPAGGHTIETTTPTGHRYRSRAPTLTHPPFRQIRPGVWAITA